MTTKKFHREHTILIDIPFIILYYNTGSTIILSSLGTPRFLHDFLKNKTDLPFRIPNIITNIVNCY